MGASRVRCHEPDQGHCRRVALSQRPLMQECIEDRCDASFGSMQAQVHAWLMEWSALGRKVVEGVGFPEPTSGFFGAIAGAVSYRGEESQHIIMNHTRGRVRYCCDSPNSNKIGDWCMRLTPAGSGYIARFPHGQRHARKSARDSSSMLEICNCSVFKVKKMDGG